ncbi:MAG: BrnT family toxin [Fibrobacteria bacterium]
MRFGWDPKKDESNLKKHGIAFEMAQLVFADPLALSVPDEGHSEGEERWVTVGQAGSHLIVLVVHTYRDTEEEEVIRLISARKATPKERKQYMNLSGGPR